MNGSPAAEPHAEGHLSGHAGATLFDEIQHLAGDLRRAGVPVALSGVMEAYKALAAVDIGAQGQVRAALRCTMLTRGEDGPIFDALFDRRFQTRPSPSQMPSRPGDRPRDGGDMDSLHERVVSALASGSTDELVDLAHEAAHQHGGFGLAEGTDRYHLQRALRALDQGSLVPDALRMRRAGARRDELTEQLNRSEITLAFDRFLAALGAATRQQRQAARDSSATAADAATGLARVEDLDITAASVTELAQLRKAVRPLAQRLAARMVRHHHRPRGALDMRRTMRRSLSSGGVPLNPSFRRRAPHKPDVWLLCDVSGSVAEFARFTIALLTALHDEVPKLRSFLFVDDIVEVTDMLAAREHDVEPFALLAGAGAPLGGRQSDWGAALARFQDQFQAALTARTTVLMTGDGRTHDRDPRPDVVNDLANRARGLWLLDPEPPAEWATGDAAIVAYQDAGAHVHEVRTLNQLATAIEHILHPGPTRGAQVS